MTEKRGAGASGCNWCKWAIGVAFVLWMLYLIPPVVAQDEYEDDDTWSRAGVVNVQKFGGEGGLVNAQWHDFHDSEDEDWVFFHAKKGTPYRITIDNVGHNCDPVIAFYASDGETPLPYEANENSAGQGEINEIIFKADGIYYAQIRQYDPNVFGEGCQYRLILSASVGPFSGWVYGIVTPACVGSGFAEGPDKHYATVECDSVAVSPHAVPCGGEFLEFMPAGQYTLSVSLPGYEDCVVPVVVRELEQTNIVCDMNPLSEDRLDFEASVSWGHMPLSAEFQEYFSGDAAERTWDFGDGTAGSLEKQPHTYLHSGEYDVSLTVTDAAGNQYSETKENAIRVAPVLFFLPIKQQEGWNTEIGVVNKNEGQKVSGVYRAYMADGSAVGNPIPFSLPALGREQFRVEQNFPDAPAIGYIALEHDIEGLAGYMRCEKAGLGRVAIPAADRLAEDELYLAHVASSSIWETEVHLANPTDETRQVAFRFDTGDSRFVEVPASGSAGFRIRDMFDGIANPEIHSARIEGCRGLVGAELFTSEMKWSGILLEDKAATRMFFPHVASDSFWYTGLVTYNPSGSPVDVSIKPRTALGEALTQKTIRIEGGGQDSGVVDKMNFPAQTAWLELISSGPVSGFELFGDRSGKTLAGYTGVGIEETRGVFPDLEKDGATGIALINPGAAPTVVELRAIDDFGNTVGETRVELGAFEKTVGTARKMFETSIAEATFIIYEAQTAVVGFQLNASSDETMLDALQGL